MFEAKLIQKNTVSPNIVEFIYERPVNFDFFAGQFISIKVSQSSNRSYSISSPPEQKNLISTIVDISPGGVGTTYLKKIKLGEKITFMGPYGHMYIDQPNTEYKEINFLCTGTGICPFISIIKHLNIIGYSGDINLLYSEKYEQDLVNLANLKINNSFLTLTREKSKPYLQGRITEHLDTIKISKKAVYFICGNTRMLVEVIKYLKSKDVDTSKIIFESFYY